MSVGRVGSSVEVTACRNGMPGALGVVAVDGVLVEVVLLLLLLL